ncbi:MAG TPA: DNA-formamidopyrimidine glycosylase family protein [Acidimicrobiales bacterium]|jgi:formamidopyrimidine-DNA glycosylase|nr:DNA-formamidopyrimidine glycosylase family protein [Acidimicrobiales bacterium]
MPELAEVEAYRRLAEARALNRQIAAVVAEDQWYLKGGLTAPAARAALEGRSLTHAGRQGKLLLLTTSDDGPMLGLRFGMSGRLLVDSVAGVDDLWYASNRDNERWDRFVLEFVDGGRLAMRDPRRLGGVTLDPPLGRLGPDALTVTLNELRNALAPGRVNRPAAAAGPADPEAPADPSAAAAGPADPAAPADPAGPADPGATSGLTTRMSLKGRLMDQSRVAGVGNLAADEILWRAGLDPTRPAGSLTDTELRRLHRHIRATLRLLLERGGSHTGELMSERRPGGVCPKDGNPLRRATVATRTTWWCPKHQH